ncbi:MAG: glycosyltransferase [Algibacter sp.]|uniref:glycosyltransferase family 2 protein n=1 Tax=Algibacter sp. TaxID=1872428 RepID=UPI00262B4E83|nr:glycosyltransferase [Algibacter sp.]MDG1729358.1 glycosyltransferase [Algibacter sp.]MDG2177329.1 glycosyltransferase [Algibacter sp.]
MVTTFTLLYAYRNRDHTRVRLSLLSLKNQKNINFKVVFVDYGSTPDYSKKIKKLVDTFEFATYYYIGHKGLLWNKSKALNYGIGKVQTDAVFIADVDVLVAPNFSEIMTSLINTNQFSLFRIGYLAENVTSNSIENSDFNQLKPTHYGDTFGVGLFPKKALEYIGGFDEFFHFYGSEDEDLNFRLITSGYEMIRCESNILLHQWHKRYPQKAKENLTVLPRLSNIQRINQRHYLRRVETQKFLMEKNKDRHYFQESDYETLKNPSEIIEIDNIKAKVIHVLNYELPLFENDIVKIIFKEAAFYNSSKYKLKTALNKLKQPYLSMKEVNDLILQKILFNYRNHNYAYEVSKDLKTIQFSIHLNN